MHNHNNKNHSSMLWMMFLCAIPLVILLFARGSLFSRGYVWQIFIGVFVAAHIWMMFRGHRLHAGDSESEVKVDIAGGQKNKGDVSH